MLLSQLSPHFDEKTDLALKPSVSSIHIEAPKIIPKRSVDKPMKVDTSLSRWVPLASIFDILELEQPNKDGTVRIAFKDNCLENFVGASKDSIPSGREQQKSRASQKSVSFAQTGPKQIVKNKKTIVRLTPKIPCAVVLTIINTRTTKPALISSKTCSNPEIVRRVSYNLCTIPISNAEKHNGSTVNPLETITSGPPSSSAQQQASRSDLRDGGSDDGDEQYKIRRNEDNSSISIKFFPQEVSKKGSHNGVSTSRDRYSACLYVHDPIDGKLLNFYLSDDFEIISKPAKIKEDNPLNLF
jgi:hypothetical protein